MYKNCLNCSEEYSVKPSKYELSKYCSLKCKGLFERTTINATCQICDKNFVHVSSRVNKAKYCSTKCYNKSQIGRGLKEFSCTYCKKTFKDSSSRDRKYCSKSCVNKSSRENWKPKYSTIRKKMLLEKMIEQCEICQYSENKVILGVHHKDGNRENNKKENLQVLCPNCHSLIHQKHIIH